MLDCWGILCIVLASPAEEEDSPEVTVYDPLPLQGGSSPQPPLPWALYASSDSPIRRHVHSCGIKPIFIKSSNRKFSSNLYWNRAESKQRLNEQNWSPAVVPACPGCSDIVKAEGSPGPASFITTFSVCRPTGKRDQMRESAVLCCEVRSDRGRGLGK